jgi:hypothetical protein
MGTTTGLPDGVLAGGGWRVLAWNGGHWRGFARLWNGGDCGIRTVVERRRWRGTHGYGTVETGLARLWTGGDGGIRTVDGWRLTAADGNDVERCVWNG